MTDRRGAMDAALGFTKPSSSRLAGSLLVGGLLLSVVALFILVASGAFPTFSARLQGSLDETAPYAAIFRLNSLLFGLSWFVQLLGFGLLTRLLLRAGDEDLATLAFVTVLVAVILAVLFATFHMSVENWAAQEAARTGALPNIYGPLRSWMGDAFRVGYSLHVAATAGYGWALLRSRLLVPWVGWLAVGWSTLWLAGILAGVGIPALPLVMPGVIGAALLWR